MPSSLPRTALLSVSLLLAALPARAQVPDPDRGIFPAFVFVGMLRPTGEVDNYGGNRVLVRDLHGMPMANAEVTLDLSQACDIDLCSVGPGLTLECANARVRGTTNSLGEIHFAIAGAARDPGNIEPCGDPSCGTPGGGSNAGRFLVNGMLMGFTTAVCMDQNGASGLPATGGASFSDVGALVNLVGHFGIVGAPAYRGRGDHNGDGVLSYADVGVQIQHAGRALQLALNGCSTYCATPECP